MTSPHPGRPPDATPEGWLAGCTRGADRDRVQAAISVSPRAALVDQPVAVTVRGLPAGMRTTLTATAGDSDCPGTPPAGNPRCWSSAAPPDAGHLVGGLTAWYGSLTDDALTADGGTVAGAQAAQADAHAKLLALLASQ